MLLHIALYRSNINDVEAKVLKKKHGFLFYTIVASWGKFLYHESQLTSCKLDALSKSEIHNLLGPCAKHNRTELQSSNA
jgi:hypothetical protein